MDNPTGIVQSFAPAGDRHKALVRVDTAQVCPRCAAGKGCGAGLLGGGAGERHIEAIIDPEAGIAPGDTVELALAPGNILKAAALVYGVPLAAALLAAGAAYAAGLADLSAAVAALLGLAGGILFSRQRCRQSDCLRQFTPTVTRRLPATAGD